MKKEMLSFEQCVEDLANECIKMYLKGWTHDGLAEQSGQPGQYIREIIRWKLESPIWLNEPSSKKEINEDH